MIYIINVSAGGEIKMGKILIYHSMRCTGCHYCEIACSFRHKGICGPSDSRIRIVSDEKNLVNVAFFCHHCKKPVCIELCPVGAIKRNEETGLVAIESEKCIGCGLCLECPLGGMSLDRVTGIAVICDLCQGEPACVEYCPQGALEYISLDRARITQANLGKSGKGVKA